MSESQLANLIALLKSAIGQCVDEEPYDDIRARLWEAVEMAYRIIESQRPLHREAAK